MCHSGPQNDGGGVGEVWEVRRRCCVPVASQNWAKKEKILKTIKKIILKTYLGPEQRVLMCYSGPQNDRGEVGEVWEMR